MRFKLTILTALLLFFIPSCTNIGKTFYNYDKPASFADLPSKEKKETLFLVGDAGSHENFDAKQKYLLNHLKNELAQAGENSSIVFLGDNLYPTGLPKKEDEKRSEAEKELNAQLDVLKDHDGKSYFIPGNHDWNKGKAGGRKAIKRQEDYVQDYYEDKKVKWYPNNACGDPKVKKIQKDLYYVFIDTQWWLHNWHKDKNINKGCEVKSRQQFLQELQAIFFKHKNDQIVVMMHHPFFSNGEHDGNFSMKTHLFPLTSWKKEAYLPLPLIGSIMPMQRTVTGNIQDIPHPKYQEMKDGIMDLLEQNKNVIFAAGHDHNLQYTLQGKHHYIISGSGSKETHVSKNGEALFASSNIGYSKLHFYQDGEVWMEFWTFDQDHQNGKLLERRKLVDPIAGTQQIKEVYPSGDDLETSKVIAAGARFRAKKGKRFFFGDQYRDTWTTPVEVPVVNLETELGGLTPIKKGGGMASNSLRLETENGEHFAMRSVLKDYTKLVDPTLADLKAIDIFSDLNSASHPFGALVIPELSRAAGIYYTKPKLVYLQRQERLGFYNPLFNEELYLLEDRPAGNRENSPHLGNSKEIISYLDLLDLQSKDNKIKIDQEWTLRSRLFDLFIHDWDRHDDQWRWATIEENGETIYRPIPRDRDQAFYRFDGVVPWLVGEFAVRKFKPFRDNLKDVKWQSFNARYFDRYFLHELEWSDWEKQISYLQENLTDEVIEKAARDLPKEVYEITHDDLVSKLKSRRGHLKDIARKLYDYISTNVSIPGSDKGELFEVEKLEGGNVIVRVFDLTKDKSKGEKLYERKFFKKETKEVRLYGKDGKDQFKISGKGSPIQIRVIGGFGKDEIEDNSKGGSRVKVYDDLNGITSAGNKGIRDLTGNRLNENEYDRKDHVYNNTLESPILGYTVDDKFWFGLNIVNTRHGFRKDPYKTKHHYRFSYSPSSRDAFHLFYSGDYHEALFNTIDIQPTFSLDNPFNFNYFGLGNDSQNPNDDNRQFNWVRSSKYVGQLKLNKSWIKKRFNLYGAAEFLSWKIDNVEGRVLDTPAFTDELLKRRNYVGGSGGFFLNARDSQSYPKQGYVLDLKASAFDNIEEEEQISFLSAEQTFYLTLGNRPSFTIASRTGWSRADGNLQFYQLPTLGQNNYLRGYRNDRFRGDEIFYQNFDLRIDLFKWRNLILPMDIGLVGGYDIGRVWLNGNSEGDLKQSTTAGLSMNVLSAMVLQPRISFSDEDPLFSFLIGFGF
ncbi:MAG: hypothetical protein AAF487_11945 [Bacteroidota bacterium]